MADAPVPLTAEEQTLLLELVARARATMSPEDAAVAAEEDVDLGESMEAAADMSPPTDTDEEALQEMSENLERTYEQTGGGPEIQEPPNGADFVEPISPQFPHEVEVMQLRRGERPLSTPDGLNPSTPAGPDEMPSLEAIARRVIPRSPELKRLEEMREKMPYGVPMREMIEKMPMAEEDPQSAHPYTDDFQRRFQELLEIAKRAHTKARDMGALNEKSAPEKSAPEKEGAEEAE